MKRIITFLLFLIAGMSMSLRAADPFKPFGKWEEDGKTFFISGLDDDDYKNKYGYLYPEEWTDDKYAAQRAQVEKVVFDETLRNDTPTNTAHWFDGFSSLTHLEGMENLRTCDVTDMSYMFRNCTSLGKMVNLYFLSTENVTSMKGMFQNCSSAETMYLPDFDLSKVTDASEMFSGCTQLTTIRCGRDWSEGTFKDDDMFKGCTKLKGDAETPTLFEAAHSGKDYARPDGGTANPGYFTTEYSNYGVFNLEDRTFTIYYGTDRIARGGVLAQKWDSDAEYRDSRDKVSKIILDESMKSYYPTSLYRYFAWFEWVSVIENLAYLNTSQVTDMSYAFSGCGRIRNHLKTLDLRSFDVHNVKSFHGMFYVCQALETIYCNEDWSKIPAESDYMFSACDNLVGGKGTLKDASHSNATYAHPDEGESNPGYFTASNSDMEIYGIFNNDLKTFTIYYNSNRLAYGGLTPEEWRDDKHASMREDIKMVFFDPSMNNIHPTSTAYWFDGFSSITGLQNVNYLHTDAVTDMSYMFRNCTSMGKMVNLFYFSPENVTSTKGMFQNCSSAETMYLPDFDMSKVTDASEMFSGCTQLTTIRCGRDWSEGTFKDEDMFKGCTNLKGDAETPTLFNATHTGKDYARPDGGTDRPGYFTTEYSNYGVFSPDGRTFTVCYGTDRIAKGGVLFKKWNEPEYASARAKVEKAVIDESMKSCNLNSLYAYFYGFSNMTEVEHLDYLDTRNVTTMAQMFDGCTSIETLDIRTFDTQNVTSFYGMFRNCSSLKTIYCCEDWSWRSVNAISLFDGCISLVGGAGTTYIQKSTNKVLFLAHPDEGESNPGYFTIPESDYPELYAKLSADKSTMTMYYDKRRPIVDGVTDWAVYKNIEWSPNTKDNRVTKIVIDKSVKDFTPTTTEEWFSSFRYVKAIVNLEYLNTSQVTNMQNMFAHCDSLVDMSVSNFDTKNVTDMSGMFSNCGKLRKLDVSKFNTSNVTDMFYMFGGCKNLTSIKCDNFDTRNVTNMAYMFFNCPFSFPLNVSNFDTRNVTDMSYMFAGCKYETHIDVSHFNTENVKTMTGMFTECKSLRSLDLRSFDVSKVTNMQVMFMNDSSLIALYANQDWGAIAPLEWSTGMFYGCPELKGGAGTVYNESYIDAAYARPDTEGTHGYFTTVAEIYATWDADNTTLTLRYDNKREENGGTTNWAVYNYLATKVVFDASMKKAEPTSTKDWFYGFSQLETIEHLDYLSTYRVKDMSYMFAGCSSLTAINVNSFYLSWAETTEGMFSYCINLTTIWCDHNWNEQLYDKNSKDMFLGCTSLVGGKGTAYDANYISSTRACTDSNLRYGYFTAIPEGATDLSGNEIYAVLESDNKTLTIRYDKQRISRGGVTDWYKYSSDAGTYHIKTVVIDPSVANAKPLTTEGWFGWFSDLTSIKGLEYLNTEYVTDMTNMFRDCSSLTTLDVTTFNTQNVTDMGFMFSGCTSLKALDLSHFDTRKVSILDNMFEDCESLTELDIRQFETEGVTDMTMLFAGCKNLETLDVTALKTGKVTDMMGMFYQCEKLTELDVSGFDMSSITSLFGMFYGCKSLRTIYCNDDWSKMPSLAYHDDMFTDCPNLVGGNNTTYSASNANDATFAHVDEAGKPGYFTTNLTYQVTLTAENGKIDVEEKDIDLTAVPKGTVLHLTAIPDNGYELASWTGYNGKELVVDDDKTIIANFAVQTFTVRFTDWNDKLIEEQVVEWGKAATAPEDPVREDYLFTSWTPADFSTVYEDMTVKAQYKEVIKYFTVTLVAENGTILVENEYIDLLAVEYGTTLHLTATPDYGYIFDHWDNYNPETGLLVTEDVTVTAYFVPQIFTLTVVAEPAEGGTFLLGGVDENQQATYMSDYTIEAIPNEGYELVEWRDGNEVLDNKTTKISGALYGDITITGVFKAKKYTVSATVIPAGAGVVKGQGEYDYGTNYTLTLEPAEGYELKEWRDGVALDEKTNTLSGIVYGNINIECVLQLKHYTITAAVNDEKMGTVTGAGTYEHGSDVTLTATANDGYQFTGWSNGSTDNPLKFTAKEDVSLTANFELIPVKEYTLTVVASPADGGQVIGSGTYKEGEEAQLVASANTGYNFIEWKEDGDKNAIRKVKVTADATYTALFEKQQAPKPEYTITVAASPAEGGSVEGGGKYEEGKTATLTATAAEGYEFVQWSDGVKDNPRVVTVTADATYTAEFKKKEVLPTEYTVTVYVSPEESGKVEGAGTYKEGETATLVALPAFGYLFDKWSDGNTENPRDIVVDKKWTLICYFTLISDGIEDINGSKSEEQGQKVLRNGKLYIILPDGREFDTTGKKIK